MKVLNQKNFTRQKLNNASAGFTIIEVVLFLALSGLFMGIAFVGIQGRTATVQFTDSMRSLQSFLVSEQNKVLNGVNVSKFSGCDGLISTGKNETCLLLGRVITFGVEDALGVLDYTKASVAVLQGKVPPAGVPEPETDLEAIYAYKPTPDSTAEVYSISWETELMKEPTKTKEINSSATLHSIGWIRSPISSRIIPIAFVDGVVLSDSSISDNFKKSNNKIRLDDEVYLRLCFRGASGGRQTASIIFGEVDASMDVTGSTNIVLKFDEESGC